MSFVFQLPDVGEGIHEAEIVELLVSVGDIVKADQEILKIETDKAVVALPAPVNGAILDIPVSVGDVVLVGDPIITFSTDEEVSGNEKKVQSAPKKVAVQQAQPVAAEAGSTTLHHKRALATPHTRQYARKMGVDINAISGSGKNGRITDTDVESYAAAPVEKIAAGKPEKSISVQDVATTESGEFGPTQRIPFKGIRKKTAEAMSLSSSTIPHVWHADDIDVSDLFEVVKKQRAAADEQGIKLTPLAFIVRAVVSALKNYPQVNSQLDEASSEIVIKNYYHVGIATDTDHGLMVPVVRDADRKSILNIAQEIQTLAEKARNREIKLDQLKGGGFTITNVGGIGGVYATPMIQPPQVAILALMAARKKPVIIDDEVLIRRVMPMVIGFDHRVLDGAMMARFMNHLKALIENPMRMLVEMI